MLWLCIYNKVFSCSSNVCDVFVVMFIPLVHMVKINKRHLCSSHVSRIRLLWFVGHTIQPGCIRKKPLISYIHYIVGIRHNTMMYVCMDIINCVGLYIYIFQERDIGFVGRPCVVSILETCDLVVTPLVRLR